jgi:hypothetical protein
MAVASISQARAAAVMGRRVDPIYRPEAFVALDAAFDPVPDARAPVQTRGESGARAALQTPVSAGNSSLNGCFSTGVSSIISVSSTASICPRDCLDI